MITTAFLLVLSLSVDVTLCFSRGAPQAQCEFMTPKHGFQPQARPPAFISIDLRPEQQEDDDDDNNNNNDESLSSSLLVVGPGERVHVTLRSTVGQFKGFMLRAEEVHGGSRTGIGTWWLNPLSSSLNMSSLINGRRPTQYLHCDGRTQNAITHTDAVFSRLSVEAFWQPPAEFAGAVHFRATVVEDFKTYWTNILSGTVRVSKEKRKTQSTTTTQESRSPRQRIPSDDFEPTEKMMSEEEDGEILSSNSLRLPLSAKRKENAGSSRGNRWSPKTLWESMAAIFLTVSSRKMNLYS